MRGRIQAALAAMAGNFVPLLGPAVVALVTLRRGAGDGSYMVMAAFLPSLAFTLLSPDTLPWTYLYLVSLLATYMAALVLKASQSWAAVMIALLVVSALGGVLSGVAIDGFVRQLIDNLVQVQQEMLAELEQADVTADPVTPMFIYGLFAFGVWVGALPGVLLGRWFQGLLYNPGGFGEEFRQLRLGPGVPLMLFGLLAMSFARPSGQTWALLCVMPLLIQALAVAHALVFRRKQTNGPLVLTLLYGSLIFPLTSVYAMIGLALVGLTDNWVNYRRRFAPAE